MKRESPGQAAALLLNIGSSFIVSLTWVHWSCLTATRMLHQGANYGEQVMSVLVGLGEQWNAATVRTIDIPGCVSETIIRSVPNARCEILGYNGRVCTSRPVSFCGG